MINQSITLKQYQSYLTAMLYFFDNICRKNDIKYTVIWGTLLGTVRDHGMIPWDGDVDVAMTRPEFEKLKKAFASYEGRFYLSYFPNHYLKTGGKYGFHTVCAKMVDKKCTSPIFCIDILMLDFLGDDEEQAKEAVVQYEKMLRFEKASLSFHLPPVAKKAAISSAVNMAVHLLHPVLFPISWLLRPIFIMKYQKFVDEYLNYPETSKYVTILPYLGKLGTLENQLQNEHIVDMPFHNFKVMATANYDLLLRTTYGTYTELPPEDKRVPYPSEADLLNCVIDIDEEMQELLDKICAFDRY